LRVVIAEVKSAGAVIHRGLDVIVIAAVASGVVIIVPVAVAVPGTVEIKSVVVIMIVVGVVGIIIFLVQSRPAAVVHLHAEVAIVAVGFIVRPVFPFVVFVFALHIFFTWAFW
jgi:hypothetical protein